MDQDELESAVDEFLEDAEAVFEEYRQGYVDADAAMTVLERHVETLAAERRVDEA